ncbi:hypothetical protein NKH77_16525 [Streptomyces sp. M19]
MERVTWRDEAGNSGSVTLHAAASEPAGEGRSRT